MAKLTIQNFDVVLDVVEYRGFKPFKSEAFSIRHRAFRSTRPGFVGFTFCGMVASSADGAIKTSDAGHSELKWGKFTCKDCFRREARNEPKSIPDWQIEQATGRLPRNVKNVQPPRDSEPNAEEWWWARYES